MTKTGWVFVVLNLLLAVFFWSATTPVLEKRSKLRKDLKTERDRINGYYDGDRLVGSGEICHRLFATARAGSGKAFSSKRGS